jgi:hypothetical protein
MSDYKKTEAARFANQLVRAINQQKRLHRVSSIEFDVFLSMCRTYAKDKEIEFDETREMFFVKEN